METPEFEWSRQPTEKIPGVPDEDIPFEKPGDLSSTPRIKQPGKPGRDDTEQDWTRYPGGKKPEDVDDKHLKFDRRCSIYSA
jgi:hypothetical protein